MVFGVEILSIYSNVVGWGDLIQKCQDKYESLYSFQDFVLWRKLCISRIINFYVFYFFLLFFVGFVINVEFIFTVSSKFSIKRIQKRSGITNIIYECVSRYEKKNRTIQIDTDTLVCVKAIVYINFYGCFYLFIQNTIEKQTNSQKIFALF